MKLTARDELVLEALCRFRIARTSDLLAVCFSDVHAMTGRDRLRRLFDGGFLGVHAGDRAQENVYTLGPEGRRWASDQGLDAGRVPRGGVEHHLAIVRSWASLSMSIPQLPGASLVVARPDWELRQELESPDVVPDLFLVLGVPGDGGVERHVAIALEVDLGSETLGLLERKLLAYDRLAGTARGLLGYRDFGLAMVLRNRGRSEAVRRLIDRYWGGRWLLWVETDGPAEPLAQLVGLLREPAETPVTTSRYGYGGDDRTTSPHSTTNPQRRTRP